MSPQLVLASTKRTDFVVRLGAVWWSLVQLVGGMKYWTLHRPSGTLRARLDSARGHGGFGKAPCGAWSKKDLSGPVHVWGIAEGYRTTMNRRRIASLLAAGGMVIGMLGLSTGSVLAADNIQYWAGNGTTDGEINNNDCADDASAHQLWIWTGTGSNVQISVDGEVVAGVQQGGGSYHFATSWHDIGTLTTGDGGNVFVTYDGVADGNAVLTLSHGCPGETEDTPPPSFEQSQAVATDTPAPPTEEAPSEEPSFEQSQAADTDVPTLPNTATVGGNSGSAPVDGAWLLVVALGVLLSSIVVLTPARARTRR